MYNFFLYYLEDIEWPEVLLSLYEVDNPCLSTLASLQYCLCLGQGLHR